MVSPGADDEVPANVLDELSAAFGMAGDPTPNYDFDDPNIDTLLGIGVPPDPSTHAPVPVDPGLRPNAQQGSRSASHDVSVDTDAAGDAPRKVIVIEEDDLPDAVYLDEAAEVRLRDIHGGDDEPTTIVIGDADEGAPNVPVPTTSRTTIDPRVRARRIAVGRARGRHRLLIAAIAVGLVAVLVAALAVLGSSWFEVRDISVQGASYSRPDVDRITEPVKGDAVLLVDTLDVEHQLEAVPWIEDAKVSTDFPHGLKVDVRERTPLAYFVGSDGKARVIDRDSRVLAVLGGAPVQYPQITGSAPDVPAGAFAGELYAGAANVVQALPPELRELLASMAVDGSAGVLNMQLTNGVTVRLGQPRDITRKLARLLIVLRQNPSPTCTTIDVTTADTSAC